MSSYDRYSFRLGAIMREIMYGLSDNYSRGWATGDVDFY